MKSAFTYWANLEAARDDSSVNLNYINLLIFKIFKGAFFNAVLHDDRMQWIIENYTCMDEKVRPVEAINLAENGQNLV